MSPLTLPVIARSVATKQSILSGEARWIASRSLSSGAHSRDPVARNDGEAMDCFAELAMTGGMAENRIDHRCRCATLGDHLHRGAAIRHLINPTVDARI